MHSKDVMHLVKKKKKEKQNYTWPFLSVLTDFKKHTDMQVQTVLKQDVWLMWELIS